MRIYIVLLLAFAFGVRAQSDNSSCIFARTELGVVCGGLRKAIDGTDYARFMGIRYARAVRGVLRFAEPQPPEPFEGVFNATMPGPVCPQRPSHLIGSIMRPVSMSEDCLHVNIYVPHSILPGFDDQSKPLLPVLFFVHGGSFDDGSGDPDAYGPEYLIIKDIVIVTVNFRVNSLGFLSLASKYIPGNAGLRDVVFALKWVQRNIRNFGGNPDEVTLGGISSGSTMAHLIAISPAVKGLGLFKRLILMSGTGIGNLYSPSPIKAKIASDQFLKEMGISPSLSQKKIHEKLTKAPIEKILDATALVISESDTSANFVPVIEIPRKGFTTIIPKHPELLLNDGNSNDCPMFVSFSNNECAIFKDRLANLQDFLRAHPILTVPQNLLLSSQIITFPLLSFKVSQEYFNGSLSTLNKYLPLCTDSFYKYPVLRMAEKRLVMNAEPTFIDEFSYTYKHYNPLKIIQGFDWAGVGHAEDLSFIFRINSVYPPPTGNELADECNSTSRIRNFMTTAVSNFVKTGHPGKELSDWPPVGLDFSMMTIDAPSPTFAPLSPYLKTKKRFFDEMYRIGYLKPFDEISLLEQEKVINKLLGIKPFSTDKGILKKEGIFGNNGLLGR